MVFRDLMLYNISMKVYNIGKKLISKYNDLTILNNLTENNKFEFSVYDNEFFVFQLLIINNDKTRLDIDYKSKSIDTNEVNCINAKGFDNTGVEFHKEIVLEKDTIQPLFFSIDVEKIKDKAFEFQILFNEKIINIKINKNGQTIENKGFDELQRLSRLAWLNSNLALDDTVCDGYLPIKKFKTSLKILGRNIEFNENGLIEKAETFFTQSNQLNKNKQVDIFKKMNFEVSNQKFHYNSLTLDNKKSFALVESKGESQDLLINTNAKLNYVGQIDYSIKITAKNDITANFSLNTLMTEYASKYNTGLGKKGGDFKNINHKWTDKTHQDILFVGNVNGGCRFKFLSNDYVKPLINLYYRDRKLKLPKNSWAKNEHSSIKALLQNNCANIIADAGQITLSKGEEIVFNFQLHITPFKPIDFKKHYKTRINHPEMGIINESNLEISKKHNLNYVNIHHGTRYNPFINYPFIIRDELKDFTNKCHKDNIGVKLYYTIREMSNRTVEAIAYKSFGDEIILQKNAISKSWQSGVSEWLKENFDSKIIPAWQQKVMDGKYKDEIDVSFIVNPSSRLENYYIEGLNWLIEKYDIDGLYIDDTALSATALERARKLLFNKKSEIAPFIDMHTWNHFTGKAGKTNCLNLYTDLLPFIDRMWIGEGFFYNFAKESYALTEISGMCYGLTSEMLQGGGNPYLGMLYAMNTRYAWTKEKYTLQINKLWDSINIQNRDFIGYWDNSNPITTTNKNIKATCYKDENSLVVALFNFSFLPKSTKIEINEKLIDFNPKKIEILDVESLQNHKVIKFNKSIHLKGKKGLIIKIS